MAGRHRYETSLRWTGNRGTGTASYRGYDRTHEVYTAGRPPLAGSSDPVFRGDADRWNPEQLLVAALSQCHLLQYLHRAAVAGVVVTAYTDTATGTMVEDGAGGGRFTEVVLRPVVTVAGPDMSATALAVHEQAHAMCFIAASVNFPVRHEPAVRVATDDSPVDDGLAGSTGRSAPDGAAPQGA